MGQVVCSNRWLLARAEAARDVLNTNHFLYLFINDFSPTPADVLSSFDPAAFPGFAPVNLTSLWPPPIKLRDGAYALTPGKFTFTCTGPTNETVYGWYVQRDGVLKLSQRLASPILISNGLTFEIRIIFQVWALSVFGEP